MMFTMRKRRRVRREEKVLEMSKSNPSQRHRHRLNKELEDLASLMPFDPAMLARLDKLSILRLAVAYIGMKNHFAATNQESKEDFNLFESLEETFKIYNGFFILISRDFKLFYVSSNITQYLGFEQSDVLQHDVRDLIYPEDHQLFAQQIRARHSPPDDCRSFLTRLRCSQTSSTINISSFHTFEINGRVLPLRAWRKLHPNPPPTQESPISPEKDHTPCPLHMRPSSQYFFPAFFGFCHPVGPSPLTDRKLSDNSFKSKHQIDVKLISMDIRLSNILFSGTENVVSSSFFNKIHPLDLDFFVYKYLRLRKMGNEFLSAYRLLLPSKDGHYIWVQSSCKVTNRSNKQNTLTFLHHVLAHSEGEKLLEQRRWSRTQSTPNSSVAVSKKSKTLNNHNSLTVETSPAPYVSDLNNNNSSSNNCNSNESYNAQPITGNLVLNAFGCVTPMYNDNHDIYPLVGDSGCVGKYSMRAVVVGGGVGAAPNCGFDDEGRAMTSRYVDYETRHGDVTTGSPLYADQFYDPSLLDHVTLSGFADGGTSSCIHVNCASPVYFANQQLYEYLERANQSVIQKNPNLTTADINPLSDFDLACLFPPHQVNPLLPFDLKHQQRPIAYA